jgi:2-dehydro-3-deoxygluconokinase
VSLAIVGNINLDIKISVLGVDEAVFTDGETSVSEIYESIGGGGANTAVAAAQLGAAVHFFGCVGDDELGSRLERAMQGFGVTTYLARRPVATGRSINLNWTNGCRHFISSLPNTRALTVEDIDIPAGCRQLLRADVWFSEPMLEYGNQRLFERARAAGVETCLDINWDPEWSVPGNPRVPARKECLRRILHLISYVHGNERELSYCTGCSTVLDACRWLVAQGCGEVIVHRGAQGAASFSASRGWVEVPAAPVDRIVCSTGSGDVFCAAHMLLSHLETRERLTASAEIAAGHLAGRRVLLPRLSAA